VSSPNFLGATRFVLTIFYFEGGQDLVSAPECFRPLLQGGAAYIEYVALFGAGFAIKVYDHLHFSLKELGAWN
jgi:hypothetical protein